MTKRKRAANQEPDSNAYVVNWQTADSTWTCLMFMFKGGTRKVLSFATNPRSFYFFSLAKMKGEIYIKRSHKRVGGKWKSRKECQPTNRPTKLTIYLESFLFCQSIFFTVYVHKSQDTLTELTKRKPKLLTSTAFFRLHWSTIEVFFAWFLLYFIGWPLS